MRVSDKMQFEQVKTNISKNRQQMADLQNQAATQKRVTKPSDDPLAASRVLSNRIDLQGLKQFSKNLNYARTFLEYTDQSLGDMSELVMRAKELALSQSNDGSGNEESRRVVATEIQQLYAQLVSIGNRKIGDRYIFGGFKTQNAPFDAEGRYFGDKGEMNVHIDKDTFLAMNVPGGRVFLGQGMDNKGAMEPAPKQAKTIEEFEVMKQNQKDPRSNAPTLRGPASAMGDDDQESNGPKPLQGTNVFTVLRDLEISLRTNDKVGVQNTLDALDDALSQVVLTRAQVGSRAASVDNSMAALEKAKVDNNISISNLEDVDIFATVSDINKTESTLQATLQTSGKMIQSSLMDFLR